MGRKVSLKGYTLFYMKVYGIITARGGSKGVPGKNIKDLCGKPLIAWTIDEAKKSKLIDRLVLTTDDEAIAEVGRRYGAETLFMRPKELAEDLTPDLPVFEHALRWFEQHEGSIPDAVVHLRPTGPLRTVEDIDAGIELLLDHPEVDSVRALYPAPHHPLKTYRLEGNKVFPFVPDEVYGIPEAYNAPRQILPKAYAASGYVSMIWSRTILDGKSMTGKNFLGYEVEKKNVCDIDSPIDFEIARMRMQERLEREGR